VTKIYFSICKLPTANPSTITHSTMNIPENQYKEIEKLIASDQSVVGIDAKKTHIIIIHMLQEIQEKIADLEKKMEKLE